MGLNLDDLEDEVKLPGVDITEVLGLRAVHLAGLPVGTKLTLHHAHSDLRCKLSTTKKAAIDAQEWAAMITYVEKGIGSPLIFDHWLDRKTKTRGWRVPCDDKPASNCPLTVGQVLAAFGLTIEKVEIEDS